MKALYFIIYIALAYIFGIVSISLLSGIAGAHLILHLIITAAGIGYFRKNVKWRGWIGVVSLLLLVVMASVPDSMRSNLLSQEILFLSLLIYTKANRIKISTFLHLNKTDFLHMPLLLVESLLLYYMAYFVNTCSLLFFKNILTESMEMFAANFPASVLIICICPAITEEMIYRGVLLKSIPGPDGKGIFISAVLFGIWHLNMNQFCYAFFCGLLLAVMAVRTGNLLYTMIVHLLFNFYNLVVFSADRYPAIKQAVTVLQKGSSIYSPVLLAEDGSFMPAAFFRGLSATLLTLILFLMIIRVMTYKKDGPACPEEG